ncbi:MAG: spermidine synthase [Planctomycetota bacterium]|jgi:spermidine synthase
MNRRFLLLAVAFVSGAAVMTAEMGLIRALAPYFGQTTYVWMNIIGVVLAALSVGYWLGGIFADRFDHARQLGLVVLAASALLLIAPFLVKPLSSALLPAPGVPALTLSALHTMGALITALVLIAPPIALLGAVGPWVTRLLSSDGVPVGQAAGRVLALSTVGSLLGTFLPPIVLIPALGSRNTVAGAGAVLCGVALLLLKPEKSKAAAAGGAALGLFLAGAGINAAVPMRGGTDQLEQVMETESPYQYVRVVRSTVPGAPWTALTLNEGQGDFHSKIIPGSGLTQAYYDWYMPLPGLVVPPDAQVKPPLRIAILGLAAGAHSRGYHRFADRFYAMQIHGVEIDPAVVEAARTHMEMTAARHPKLMVAVADARPWLQANHTRYHLIVLDAFAQQLYIPFYLATQEFFTLAQERLEPGGLLAFNVYPALEGGELTGALASTLQSVFGAGNVWSMSLPYSDGNLLVVARNGGTGDLDRGAMERVFHANLQSGNFANEPERNLFYKLTVQLQHRLRPMTGSGRLLTDDDAPVEILTERDLKKMRAARLAEAK